jgi:outer membrane protein assembly factor BamB
MSEESPFEWSAFYDDDGRIYYYNAASGESSWEAPEQYNPPSDDPPPVTGAGTKEPASSSSSSAWVSYQDDEGRTYYFNTETEETTWDTPAGFVEEEPDGTRPPDGATHEGASEDEVDGVGSPIRKASPEADAEESLAAVETDAVSPEREPGEKTEPIEPEVRKVDIAMAALRQSDAIMEPGKSVWILHG